jgi:hypothetical protein
MTQNRVYGKLEPSRELGLKSLPCRVVHADLTPAPALATTDQHGATPRVEIGLGERERLADPKPCAPLHGDQTASALPWMVLPAAYVMATISSPVGRSAK